MQRQQNLLSVLLIVLTQLFAISQVEINRRSTGSGNVIRWFNESLLHHVCLGEYTAVVGRFRPELLHEPEHNVEHVASEPDRRPGKRLVASPQYGQS